MLKEFREFLNRGNVIDLAVAVVLGAAFNQIVNSLVADLLTPLIGIALGGINFGGLAIQVGEATLTYGNLIQATINFLLTALALFLIVKAYNSFRRKEEQTEEAVSQEVVLLTQIRDALMDGRSPVKETGSAATSPSASNRPGSGPDRDG